MCGLVELSASRHSLNVKLIEGRPLRETPFMERLLSVLMDLLYIPTACPLKCVQTL